MNGPDPASTLQRLTDAAATLDPVALAVALVAGLALGALFFAGLLWTVRRGLTARHPGLLFLTSLLVRTVVAVTGILWVTGAELPRVVVCLSGFLIARVIVMRMGARNPPEAGDAPGA